MKDYKKMMGMKAGEIMKNHGNTKEIKPDSQKYDMGRLQPLKSCKKGYSDKAHDYKH
jgi:hypothetical protein